MKHKRTTELRYPGLWRGCVGAWAPCLGPTGLTLRDWSGYGRHGTLTNMDAGTDWVASQGRYALDFDGTNDFVAISGLETLLTGASKAALAFWVRRTGTNALAGLGNGLGNRFNIGWYSGNVFFSIGSSFPYTALSSSGWVHVAMSYDGALTGDAKVAAYINGQRIASLTAGGTVPDTLPSLAAMHVGGPDNSRYTQGQHDEVCVFNRVLSPQEHLLLASRRGIAYELAPRRRASVLVAAAFNRRRRLLIGAGS